MVDKWTRVAETMRRQHDDLGLEQVTYYTYSESYDNAADEMTTSETELGTVETEVARSSTRSPLTQADTDTTRAAHGTDTSFDVTFRVKDTVDFLSDITVYGDDNELASEAEVKGRRYQIQDKIPEPGSGFTVLPATEI